MNSIWVEGAERPSFAKLTENIKTDVLIIGGGAHRTGKKGGARQELVAFARAHYGKAFDRPAVGQGKRLRGGIFTFSQCV